jgi:lysophospholipase L1-like esterase
MTSHQFSHYLIKAFFSLLVVMVAISAYPLWAASTKRILVYGDSNAWGWIPGNHKAGASRYGDNVRWPGVLQKHLGKHYVIEVDALPGRTLNADYPRPTATLKPEEFNGEKTLPLSLAIHTPLDLVIIVLGTNDIRDDLHRSELEISEGLAALIDSVKKNARGIFTNYPQPQILIVTPAPVTPLSYRFEPTLFSQTAEAKSKHLFDLYCKVAKPFNIPVINASQFIQTDGADGIHYSQQAHDQLGKKLTQVVQKLLNN